MLWRIINSHTRCRKIPCPENFCINVVYYDRVLFRAEFFVVEVDSVYALFRIAYAAKRQPAYARGVCSRNVEQAACVFGVELQHRAAFFARINPLRFGKQGCVRAHFKVGAQVHAARKIHRALGFARGVESRLNRGGIRGFSVSLCAEVAYVERARLFCLGCWNCVCKSCRGHYSRACEKIPFIHRFN